MGKKLIIPGADFSKNAIEEISSIKTVEGNQSFQILDSVEGVKSFTSDAQGYQEITGNITFNGAYNANNLFNIAPSATDNVIEAVKHLRLNSNTPQYAFYKCGALKEVSIAELNILTNNAISCGNMFRYCTNLEKLSIKSSHKIKVQSLNFTFADGSKNLLKLDLTAFDVSALTGMMNFFNTGGTAPYPKLQEVDFSGWDLSSFDISTTTNYQYAFNLCTSLQKAIINGCNAATITKLKTILSTVSPSNPWVWVESTDASGNSVLIHQS